MTRYGVYILVFDMKDLLKDPNSDQCKESMGTIKFWLDSVAIHTLSELKDTTTGGERVLRYQTAPVAIVGTRKDKVQKIQKITVEYLD